MKNLPFQLLKKIWAPSALFVVVLISLWGTYQPIPKELSSFHEYQVGSYTNGLSLYLPQAEEYYQISPLDDFIVYPSGVRTALLPKEKIESGVYKSSQQRPWFLQRINSAIGQLRLSYPSYHYESEALSADYYIAQDQSTLLITRELTTKEPVATTGVTFKFGMHDLVFDENRQLYTKSDPISIAQVAELSGINLLQNPSQEDQSNLLWSIDGNSISIINLYAGEILNISATPSQQIILDTKNNLIQLVTKRVSDSTTYKDQMIITTQEILHLKGLE